MAASTSPLFVLPPDIIQLVLHEYCRGKDIFALSLALETSRSHRESSRSLIGAVLQKRLNNRVKDEDKWTLCFEDEASIATYISRFCALLDYFEQLQHVLWCGKLDFNVDGLYGKLRCASTLLRSPPCCSPVALSQWHVFRHTCRPIKLQARHYNFIPVPPFGQIIGATRKDQDILREIGSQMEAQNHVLTLSSQEGGFILRVISPSQARQRLGRFGTGYRPKDSWVVENPTEGLVCSWEYPPESDSNPLPNAKDTIQSILHVVKNWEQLSYEQAA
jgi:hypothetical protein